MRKQGAVWVLFFAALVLLGSSGLAAAEATGELAIEEYFNKGQADWQVLSGDWEVQGWDEGHLFRQKQTSPKAYNALAVTSGRKFADFTAETRVRYGTNVSMILDEDERKTIKYTMGAGITFRAKDEDNFYLFRLAGDEGLVLGKVVDGCWIELENPRLESHLNWADYVGKLDETRWYMLKVEVAGQQIRGYLDGNLVVTHTDSASPKDKGGCSNATFPDGAVGMTTFRAFADFDHFKVWTP